MDHHLSQELLSRGKHYIPGGVSSNVREGIPIVVSHGIGGELFEVGGVGYIDYVLGFGPCMLGHGHPAIVEAVTEAVKQGTTFALSTELELDVCQKIADLFPSIEMVRLCNSGTDASITAYRVASAYTGRHKIIRIQGDYNGGYDPLLYDVTGVDGSRLGIPTPLGKGLLKQSRDLVTTVPFNDLGAMAHALEQDPIAAVFLH